MKHKKEIAHGEVPLQHGWTVVATGPHYSDFQSVVLDGEGERPGIYLVTGLLVARPLSPEAMAVAEKSAAEGTSPLLAARAHIPIGMMLEEETGPLPIGDQLRRLGATMLAEEPPK